MESHTSVRPVRAYRKGRSRESDFPSALDRFHKDKRKLLKPLALNRMDYHNNRTAVVSIDPGSADSIRPELKHMGIDHATVYADLGSVCRAITDDLAPASMRR
jgi:hypothetical protein